MIIKNLSPLCCSDVFSKNDENGYVASDSQHSIGDSGGCFAYGLLRISHNPFE